MQNVYQFEASSLAGQPVPLADFRGKVLLIVNTASECGFTPQYAGLQALQDAYQTRGFDVLGFPCNQFGKQEPGDAEQIGAFCESRFHVTFPMFAKIEVNGDDAHPLYRWLRDQKGGVLGDRIKWNFTKFLIGRDGQVIDRFGPSTKPAKIAGDIEAALAS